MKRWIVAVLLLVASGSARAQGVEKGAFGLGIIIGEPTGIAGKLYLDDDNAVQAALGSAFIGGGWHLHADYLWHPWILEERDGFTLPAYVGPGARLIYYDNGRGGPDYLAVGPRVVVGILFDFTEIPLDVFIEVAGVIEWRFAPDELEDERGVGLSFNGGLGARYYF